MTDDVEVPALLAVAHRAADAGGEAALRHFRAPRLVADNKSEPGGFDPVTAADRAAESAMRQVIGAHRPDDSILGEEEARHDGTSGLTWIIDPVDGTRAFISGLPTWGVLIGLDDGSAGRIGIVDQPYTGERFTGVIDGARTAATLTRGGESARIAVRACPDPAAATLFTTAPEMFSAAEAARFDEVRRRARLTRYGTDCYAFALLAMGQIDIVIEAGLAPYDIAGPGALVRAAGGVVTDWQGGDYRAGGCIVAAGDRSLHAAVLELLNQG